jgi:hypothetical protein
MKSALTPALFPRRAQERENLTLSWGLLGGSWRRGSGWPGEGALNFQFHPYG